MAKKNEATLLYSVGVSGDFIQDDDRDITIGSTLTVGFEYKTITGALRLNRSLNGIRATLINTDNPFEGMTFTVKTDWGTVTVDNNECVLDA